jgi:uncharacterized protein YkwD
VLRRTLLPLAATALALAVPATAAARGDEYIAKRLPLAHAAGTKARSAQDCPNADLVPNAGNLAAVRAAVVCLHNRIRAEHGLAQLGTDAKLRKAALGHSADMVGRDYFEHTSPRGVTMVDRIRQSGYVRPSRAWLIGENLEWGTGSLATPRGAMKAWMNSAGHRANILRGGYRELGVGIALGTPQAGLDGGATYTVDFGAIG